MKVDMSNRAIATRLRQVSQLRRLCLSLSKAKPLASAPSSADSKEAASQTRASISKVI
jgi:hypothetical protein